MTGLVCLLLRDDDAEDGYEISFILPEGHPRLIEWRERESPLFSTRPFREGDVAATSGNNVLEALTILSKYFRNIEVHPGHEQIWIGDHFIDYDGMVAVMSKEDIDRMERLDWFEDEGAWSGFL